MDDNRVALIGEAFPRKEDGRLTTGAGSYTADNNLPAQAYAKIVRSPYAHAHILGFDLEEANAVPGVLAIFTGADLAADKLGSMLHDHALLGTKVVQARGPDLVLVNRDGSPLKLPPHHLMGIDRARYCGEPVAMVIAETVEAARQAADLVGVDYEELPSVVSVGDASESDAVQLWEECPGNVSVDAEVGDPERTEHAFATAAHIARIDTHIARITGSPMEPRAALGDYDADTGKYTLYAGTSGVIRHRNELAHILGVPVGDIRVISRDVGGSFGTRNAFYSEQGLVVWAAKKIGRPVKWTSTRSECFLSDYQGRDLTVQAELALDKEGRFLGLRGVNTSNLGGYAASHIPLRKGVGLMTSVYDIPAAHFIARGVLTNTVPTTPVRSAGRPEAMFVIERLIDIAAHDFGFDRIEIRRKNIIPPEALPYPNALGLTYDNGEYAAVMDSVMQLAKWEDFPRRRAESHKNGRIRGIGIANYIEITSGPPVERAEITVLPEGVVELVIGTGASGQGHETSFAQLISEWLNVPIKSIRLVQGDTDRVTVGGGSVSGRSMRFGAVVIGKAVDQIISRARRLSALLLDAAEEDIRFEAGTFFASPEGRRFNVFDIARETRTLEDLPAELFGPLAGVCEEFFTAAGFPYGAQVCEVEINPDTGEVAIVNVAAVDDVGRAVNPLILHGQTHGGIAMGLGQAFMEQIYFDESSGQLLSGSFQDYAMPHAHQMPFFATELSEVPSFSNKLGIRAGGEGGTTPALAAAVNAAVDALAPLGIRHLDMPLTAAKIWSAIQDAQEPNSVRVAALA